ncbi:MAG TPA: type II toxin-antitoxin system RelE/ParE family toxin [Rhizomicrobium sp.]|nr:type II toxin-antitoxin system RelE/ParE family toxin [Rhizomicrobium sp.]
MPSICPASFRHRGGKAATDRAGDVCDGQRVIVLRTFIKKTEKTPPREIDLALARMKEIRE